jgi:hypothetical protein
LSDWISSFLTYSEGIPSPDQFRLWSAIGVVAGAMERRVWTRTRGVLYPNLFTLLVAPPGIGKSQSIDLIMELVYAAKSRNADGFHIAPDSMTRASLIDTLAESSRRLILPSGSLLEYHSLFIPSAEFGVLVPSHDLDFLSVLNKIFDNGRVHRERRRGGNLNTEIINPQLNILAGSQPGFLGSLLPEEAWTMGFTSRLLLIYAAVGPKVDFFGGQSFDPDMEKLLVRELQSIYRINGEMTWHPDALLEARAWYEAGLEPVPQHSKLQHYIPRRMLFVAKLAMVSCMSDGQRMEVEKKDFLRARNWLLDAEGAMPDIFRDMAGRSDVQVIQELHFFLWGLYAKEKKPVHEARVFNWLSSRVPSEKIKYVLEIAEKSGVIKVTDSGMFIPRPKHEHGEE